MKKKKLLAGISLCLEQNSGKLTFPFLQSLVETGTVQYLHPTSTMRLCIITLESGHEVLGVAQVLDPANDIEELGNKVAYDNAIGELWGTIGSIAKAIS